MLHIHPDGAVSISTHQMWLPGIYDSPRTARWAFQFTYEELSKLSKRVCTTYGEYRLITRDDLRKLRS